MLISDRVLGSTVAKDLRGRANAPLIRIGTDTFTRDAALTIDATRRGQQPKPARRETETKEERRMRTARTLAQIADAGGIPRKGSGRGLQPLVRYGYLATKGNKYVRTSKPFEP